MIDYILISDNQYNHYKIISNYYRRIRLIKYYTYKTNNIIIKIIKRIKLWRTLRTTIGLIKLILSSNTVALIPSIEIHNATFNHVKSKYQKVVLYPYVIRHNSDINYYSGYTKFEYDLVVSGNKYETFILNNLGIVNNINEIGHLSYDIIFETRKIKDNNRYNISLSLSPYVNSITPYQYSVYVNTVIKNLHAISHNDCCINIVNHPSVHKDHVIKMLDSVPLKEFYNNNLNVLSIFQAIGEADLYIASTSSTLNIAAYCGVSTLNQDIYQYGDIVFIPSKNHYYTNKYDISEYLIKAINNLTTVDRILDDNIKYFDGLCHHRLKKSLDAINLT